ncbi:MAG: dipeptide ABC transporter ATP-binding protein [Methyloligellaceae bacterium]
MTTDRDLLRIEDLRISFKLLDDRLEVVKGVSFRIRPGEIVALVGESGSGKSVISQAIMGILPKAAAVTAGHIYFSDPETPGETIDISGLPWDGKRMRSLRGGRISIIFQEPMTSLSQLHTIGNQIQEALCLHRNVGGGEARELTEEMLGLVGFPDQVRAYSRYPFELSGGLSQRAMIAMALICRPALLIADEPTTALDVTIQVQILKLLKDLQKKLGMAVLLITHDLGVVANMADEVVVIYNGEIMESGTKEHIFRQPRHVYLKALFNAVPHFDMKPGERLVSLRDIDSEIGLLRRGQQPDPETAPEHILSVRDLHKTFTSRKGSFFGQGAETRIVAVDGVSFDIRRGECLGLVGESGCGKTTISKLIMRAVTADSGSIIFRDHDGEKELLDLPPDLLKPLRQRIQMVFQNPYGSVNPRMTIFDILREPLIIHGLGDSSSQAALVTALMHVVGLDPRYLSRYPHSFSGGQRQRIGIARALALNPRLLICDEPVSALDVSVQAQILNLLKDLQKELGLTYLFISHDLSVIDYMADRIAVMYRGRIVEVASRETLFHSHVHPYTRKLLKAVPYADLDRPLDIAALQRPLSDGNEDWAAPFRSDSGQPLQHLEIKPGHLVLANPNADIAELRPH